MARHRVHWHNFLHVRIFWWTAHERQSTIYLKYEISDMNLAGLWVILCKHFESTCDTMKYVPEILDPRNRDTNKKKKVGRGRKGWQAGNIFVPFLLGLYTTYENKNIPPLKIKQEWYFHFDIVSFWLNSDVWIFVSPEDIFPVTQCSE